MALSFCLVLEIDNDDVNDDDYGDDDDGDGEGDDDNHINTERSLGAKICAAHFERTVG